MDAKTMIRSRAHTSHGREDSIASKVLALLRSSSYPELRRLDCTVTNGVLAVRGRLPSFYLKQLALSVIANVAGLDRFDDGIEVPPVSAVSRNRGSSRLDRAHL